MKVNHVCQQWGGGVKVYHKYVSSGGGGWGEGVS